ncbi:MAG TPA: DUF5671 domain-containing protein [Vicinamibacterales bacterium]|nr:DUF5671 domain-containing protein [Vicinamibacterales bacterium]
MSESDDLDRFVKEALARGLARDAIRDTLGRAGWRADQVAAALRRYAEIDFPVPVPRPKPYLEARDAFMYLVMFTTLYITAFQLGSLLFNIINSAFPDAVRDPQVSSYARTSMRWSIAMIVVAFPVFLLMATLIGREVAADPAKRVSAVRKWLTYLTLFVAASVLIGDVTTLVYNLLGGETTVRFLLKAAVVAIIAGTAFWYYLWDLRKDERQ